MIPKILHQTWKTGQIPEEFEAYVESWITQNPGWKRILWTDRALLDFVAANYPDFLPVYASYQNGVMRADAARYMLLHHYGGVYADLDCECLKSFDEITTEDRIVVCKEPKSHEAAQADWRGLPYFLFNGTLASPKGHPFWLHLLDYLKRGASIQRDVLDITGPCILTSAQLSYENQKAFAIHSESLFAPVDSDGVGQILPNTLSVHHWAGTWWNPMPKETTVSVLKTLFYKLKYRLSRGAQFDPKEVLEKVKIAAKRELPPLDGKVAIFIPIRNSADHLAPLGNLLANLTHMNDRLRIVFCEGDSTDSTPERLSDFKRDYSTHFADISVLTFATGIDICSDKRWLPKFQRARRSQIAKVRNHLIKEALRDDDDWVLWLDADVCAFPPDILKQLLSVQSKIAVPNCVKIQNGQSFDLNSFVTRPFVKDYRYYRAIKNGLYQPKAYVNHRYHLSDLKHLQRVQLDSVGGCMMLVDASLHRAGLIFPEEPYEDLIETEAFGLLANQCGVRPVGLPQVEIKHVPW